MQHCIDRKAIQNPNFYYRGQKPLSLQEKPFCVTYNIAGNLKKIPTRMERNNFKQIG